MAFIKQWWQLVGRLGRNTTILSKIQPWGQGCCSRREYCNMRNKIQRWWENWLCVMATWQVTQSTRKCAKAYGRRRGRVLNCKTTLNEGMVGMILSLCYPLSEHPLWTFSLKPPPPWSHIFSLFSIQEWLSGNGHYRLYDILQSLIRCWC